MRTKITVTLVILNVALFSFILYFEDRIFGSDAGAETSNRIFQLETAQVDYLRIDGKHLADTHVLERERERWRLTSPLDWPANHHAVSRILNQIQLLERETSFSTAVLERTDQTLADYGLDNPDMTLIFGYGNTRYELRFAATGGIGNRLYILDPAKDTIHVARREILSALAMPLDQLRSDSIFDIPLFEVRSLTLEITSPQNLKMRVVRSDDKWAFETPIQVPADEYAVQTTVNRLSALKVRRFNGEGTGDLAEYGLNRPTMRITLDGNMRSQELLVGNEVAETTDTREYFAKKPQRADGPATIFTVDADRIDELKDARETLRDRQFLRFSREQLTSIEIGVPNRDPVTLQRLETGQWQLVARQPDQSIRLLPSDTAIVNRLISRLEELRARSFRSDAPSSEDIEEFGLDEPQRSVTLYGASEITLHLGYFSKTRANEIYAKIDGEAFVYTVDSSILEALPVLPQFYRDRLLMSRPDGARITSVNLYSLDREQEIFSVELPSDQASWDDVLNEEDEAVRKAVLALIPELRQLRVQSYVLDEFPRILTFGQEDRPWVYILETTYSLTGGDEDLTTDFELYLTDQMGGESMFVGSWELNVVFLARQTFVDAVTSLIDTFENVPPPFPEPALDDSTAEPDESAGF